MPRHGMVHELQHDMTMVPRLIVYTAVQVPLGLVLYAATDSLFARAAPPPVPAWYWPTHGVTTSTTLFEQLGFIIGQFIVGGALYSMADRVLNQVAQGYHDPSHGVGFMMMMMMASPTLMERVKQCAGYVDHNVQSVMNTYAGKMQVEPNEGGASAEVRKGNIGDPATGNKIVQPRSQQQLANPMVY